jgi:hypothetical protein
VNILRRRLVVVPATAMFLLAMAGTAMAQPHPPGRDAAGSSPQLVVPGSSTKVTPFTGLKPVGRLALPGSEKTTGTALDPKAAAEAGSKLKKVDNPAEARSRNSLGGVRAAPSFIGNPSYYCDEYIADQMRVDYDESGAQRLQVDYYGDVACNFYLYEGTGVAGIIDRTPGYDGQVLSVGNVFDFRYGYYGYSTGQMVIWGDIDPHARSIEIADEAYLYSPIPWGACNPLPGLRYLVCDGLGTYVLHVVVGTGPITTGLQNPPPLYIGGKPGDQCSLSTLIEADHATQDPGDGMHRVTISKWGGSIACPNGFSGTSQAVLHSVGPAPGADRDLASGSQTGTRGTSTGPPVTVAESEAGGRAARIIYSGRTTAPPGRTWGDCHDPGNGDYSFVKCSINGNTIDWEVRGRVIGTDLPNELHCEVQSAAPTEEQQQQTVQVRAGAVATCDGMDLDGRPTAAEEISLDVHLRASYTDKDGQQQDREVGYGVQQACRIGDIIMLGCFLDEESSTRLPDTTLADFTRLVVATCVNDPAIEVDYSLDYGATIRHDGGWIERTDLDSVHQKNNCVPE